MDKPFLELLSRESAELQAERTYQPQIELLEDLANYGTHVVKDCFTSSPRKLADIVVNLVQQKHVVAMADASSVLLRHACLDALFMTARSLLEASLAIDWILDSKTELKCQHYYVAALRKQRIWARRVMEGSQEEKWFTGTLGPFGDSLSNTRNTLGPGAKVQDEAITAFLQKPPYNTVNAAFERSRGKRPYDPAWYVPLGCTSVRKMAENVKRLHEYQLIYPWASEAQHAAQYYSQIRADGGKIAPTPVRHLNNAGTLVRFIAQSILHSYQSGLTRYRPAQLKEFGRRYISDWRTAFLGASD